MNGEKRRYEIIEILTGEKKPVSGSSLAEKFNISRQVIVQDIALLRAQGYDILSASRGYVLTREISGAENSSGKSFPKKVFKVVHKPEDTEKELNIFVDYGARVLDIFIYHKVYGKITVPLVLSSRLDVKKYMEKINSGESGLLSNATSGYHYHTLEAETCEIFQLIQKELEENGFLAQLTDYEPVEFK
ncbi:MAG: transcription repressor NadR [Hornefia sp.]|nr:transcription repressor NadR [Hornefia sp.]